MNFQEFENLGAALDTRINNEAVDNSSSQDTNILFTFNPATAVPTPKSKLDELKELERQLANIQKSKSVPTATESPFQNPIPIPTTKEQELNELVELAKNPTAALEQLAKLERQLELAKNPAPKSAQEQLADLERQLELAKNPAPKSAQEQLAELERQLELVKNPAPKSAQDQLAELERQLVLAKNPAPKSAQEQLAELERQLFIAKNPTPQDQLAKFKPQPNGYNSNTSYTQAPYVGRTEINHGPFNKLTTPDYIANNRIKGQVTAIVPNINRVNNNNNFYIKSITTGNEYHCHANFFLKLHVGDFVQGLVYRDPNSGICNFIKETPPFVELNFSREAICELFVKILRGKGFGQVSASRLYDYLAHINNDDQSRVAAFISEQAIKYNEKNDPKLLEPFINANLSDKNSEKLLNDWYRERDIRRLWLLGLSNTDIKNIGIAPDHIYEHCLKNPYVIYQLNQEKAQIINRQLNLNLGEEDEYCGKIVRFIYERMTKNAWTCVPIYMLKKNFEHYGTYIQKLLNDFQIKIELDAVYLKYPFYVESEFASQILDKIEYAQNYLFDDPHFKRSTLTDEQKVAIRGALMDPISIITGGAGTGKTTIIDEIVHNLDLQELTYLIVSFTGKAVARVKEVIPTLDKKKAKTIHLCLSKGNLIETVPPAYIIVDEATMVPIDLIYRLLKSYGFLPQLILVGDKNQLPAISWGAFFQQLIVSEKIKTYFLKVNHRSMLAEGVQNGIILNSQRIIDYVLNSDYASEDADVQEPFYFIPTANFHVSNGNIESVYSTIRGLKQYGLKAEQLTVISPYRRFLLELNSECQTIFNEGNRMIESGKICWMVNDRVMMKDNNYDINIYNGEEGIITDIVNDNAIRVKFGNGTSYDFKTVNEDYDPYDVKRDDAKNDDDDEKDYDPKSKELTVKWLCHSFGVSVHKYQGSENDYIIIYIPASNKDSTGFLNYQLIYTAITRAKKAVFIIGDIAAIQNAAVSRGRYRYDNLARRIKENFRTTDKVAYLPFDKNNTLLHHVDRVTAPAYNES